MYEGHLDRLGHGDLQAECHECGQAVAVPLLRSLRQESEESTAATVLCLACLTLELWRWLAADSLEVSEAAALPGRQFKQCDRCKRRSRPTHEHHGFNLCSECAGADAGR